MTEENGLSCPLRFYSMLVHLRTGSRQAEENVAVKNIWQKDNLVFMDLYFYRSKKSQVIDSVYVKDIFDLSTEKFYASPELFIRDYCAFVSSQGCETESELPETPQFDFKHLEPIKDTIDHTRSCHRTQELAIFKLITNIHIRCETHHVLEWLSYIFTNDAIRTTDFQIINKRKIIFDKAFFRDSPAG